MVSLMVHPSLSSEKAVANYSIKLVESIQKYYPSMTSQTYLAGHPFSLFRNLNILRKSPIVHIQHEYNLLGYFGLPFFFLFLFLGLFKKGKLVTTMHTVLSQKENFRGSKLKTMLRKILYKTQNKLINWASDKIVVHADFFKSILITEYGFSKTKVNVIPQAIIENVVAPSRTSARKKLRLSGKVYLIIGSFVPDHGADIIINQANKIGKTILIAANPCAVNDRNEKRLKNFINYNLDLIKTKKLEKFVRFDLTEKLNSFDLWWTYFAAADLVLLPYRGGIGSGIFADSIAMHIPMVGSDISYFREYSKKFKFIKVASNNNYSLAIQEAMKKKNYLIMKKEFDNYISLYGTNFIGKIYQKLYL